MEDIALNVKIIDDFGGTVLLFCAVLATGILVMILITVITIAINMKKLSEPTVEKSTGDVN